MSEPDIVDGGDIVERLRAPRRGCIDDIVFEVEDLCMDAAAEIERLRRERDEARQLVTEANNSLFGSQAYFHSMNGGPFDRYHLSRGIEQIKDDARRHWQESQAAESAVAAAWEEAADWHDQQSELAMNSLHCGDNTSTIAAFRRSANWHTECAEHFRSRASAIRAAVGKGD